MPELRAPLGIAIGALLFHPHGRGQDQIGGFGGDRRIGIRDDDEVFRVSVAGIPLLHHVRGGLHIVVHLDPIAVDFAVLQVPVLQYGMGTDLGWNRARWQLPLFFRDLAVVFIHDDHVRR